MTKLLDKEPDFTSLGGTPSRIEEREPKGARTLGMVGACFLLFGTGMWIYNAYQAAEATPPFRPLLVYIWMVLGVGGLLYHAVRDRAVNVQRAYGFIGLHVLFAGACYVLLAVGGGWIGMTAAVIAVCIVGLFLLISVVGPFVRDELECDCPVEPPPPTAFLPRIGWLARKGIGKAIGFWPRWAQGMTGNSVVQQVTVVAVLLIAAVIASSAFVVNRYSTLNFPLFGYVAMTLGLAFLLPSAAAELSVTWRDSLIYTVGVLGWVFALVGLSPVVADWLGPQETLLPHGLTIGLFGFVLLWAFMVLKGSDTEIGYNTALGLTVLGGVVFVLAALRAFVPALAFEPPAYRIPATFFLMLLSGLYAALGTMLASDVRLLVMIRRELAAFFFSPIGYIVVAGMAVLAFWSFSMFLDRVSPETPTAQPLLIPEPIIRFYYFALIPVISLTLFVPMTTMRLLSEEQRTGTLEVLLTAPVGEGLIVLSKFFAAWIFFMVAWLTWAVFPVALRVIGQESFDYRPFLSFYLGMTFMSAGFLSMGLFCSSLTRNQIIAFLLACVGMILLMVPYFTSWTVREAGGSDTKIEIFRYVSYLDHLDEFVQGKVFFKFIAFHLSVTIFWLFLTVKVLEARKWR